MHFGVVVQEREWFGSRTCDFERSRTDQVFIDAFPFLCLLPSRFSSSLVNLQRETITRRVLNQVLCRRIRGQLS